VGTTVMRSIRFLGSLQQLGPYLLLEILLPGGTLFALFLLFYQRRHKLGAAALPATRGCDRGGGRPIFQTHCVSQLAPVPCKVDA